MRPPGRAPRRSAPSPETRAKKGAQGGLCGLDAGPGPPSVALSSWLWSGHGADPGGAGPRARTEQAHHRRQCLSAHACSDAHLSLSCANKILTRKLFFLFYHLLLIKKILLVTVVYSQTQALTISSRNMQPKSMPEHIHWPLPQSHTIPVLSRADGPRRAVRPTA